MEMELMMNSKSLGKINNGEEMLSKLDCSDIKQPSHS